MNLTPIVIAFALAISSNTLEDKHLRISVGDKGQLKLDNNLDEVIVSQTGPTDLERWEGFIKSWQTDGIDRRFYLDADASRVIRDVVPALAHTVAGFRTPIEKSDIFRLAVLFRDGGVYADLDQELMDKSMLMKAVASGHVIFPVDISPHATQLGQSIMASPPGHPFCLRAIEWMVSKYNSSCYEVDNTGPDALTEFFTSTGGCEYWGPHGVAILKDMMTTTKGQRSISFHHKTGSWRTEESMNRGSLRLNQSYPCKDSSRVHDAVHSKCMMNLEQLVGQS